ncbi:MAG: redoxin domain-containing protein, partial [Alphaproteobacteria bacterium]|nr:redoxin domain-containing protein [Alphaproteobacteria bacterium]
MARARAFRHRRGVRPAARAGAAGALPCLLAHARASARRGGGAVRRTLAILLAACALPCAAADFRAFDASSPAMIRAEQAGKPFVLAFWSVTCEPCRDEMPLWKAMRKKYPRLPIVLVAADPPADHAAATRFLKQYDPGSVQRWAFAD